MRCHNCGEKATGKYFDPYFEELPELLEDPDTNEEEWWCDECYQERADDI